MAKLQNNQIVRGCMENCECHYGVPFDQCECSCPSWCGNPEFNYVFDEDPEPFITLRRESNE